MSAAVRQLPTELTVTAAWDEYVALIRGREADPVLMTNYPHAMTTARAWKRWFDLFLEFDRTSR